MLAALLEPVDSSTFFFGYCFKLYIIIIIVSFLKVSILLKTSQYCSLKYGRKIVFQHYSDKVFCLETRKSLQKKFLVGEVRAERMEEEGTSARSYSILISFIV